MSSMLDEFDAATHGGAAPAAPTATATPPTPAQTAPTSSGILSSFQAATSGAQPQSQVQPRGPQPAPDNSPNIKTATIPDWLGGGAYNVDQSSPNTVINTGHTSYGGEPAVAGSERDDIIPVSLGGQNSNPANIQIQPGYIGGDAAASDTLEKSLAQQYKAGKITLAQARLQIMTEKQQQKGTVTGDSSTSVWTNFLRDTINPAPEQPQASPDQTWTDKEGDVGPSVNTQTGDVNTLRVGMQQGHGAVGVVHNVFGSLFNTVMGAVDNAGNAGQRILHDSLDPLTNKITKAINPNFNPPPTTRSAAQNIADVAKFGQAELGLIPSWLAFNASLNAARNSTIPVVNGLANATNSAFGWVQKSISGLAEKGINAMPLDTQTKATLAKPLADLFGTLGTVLVFSKTGDIVDSVTGKTVMNEDGTATEKPGLVQNEGLKTTIRGGTAAAMDPLGTLLNVGKALAGSIADKAKATYESNQGALSADEAAKVVNEATKETPANVPATIKVTTSSGKELNVDSQQGLVLKTLIKGQEALSYQRVRDLGKDSNGNSINARFEWNYNDQSGKILYSSKSTVGDLVHEFGHYMDRNLTTDVGTKMSDLLPDYEANKTEINASLASYAASKLTSEGKANFTPDDINNTISDLANKFHDQVYKLTGDKSDIPATPGEENSITTAKKAALEDSWNRLQEKKLNTENQSVIRQIEKAQHKIEDQMNENSTGGQGGNTNVMAEEHRNDFGEKFATAVRNVLINPKESAKVAPEFTQYIQNASQHMGWMDGRISSATRDPGYLANVAGNTQPQFQSSSTGGKSLMDMSPEELNKMRSDIAKNGGAKPGSIQDMAGVDNNRPFNERQMEIAANKGDTQEVQKLVDQVPKDKQAQYTKYIDSAKSNESSKYSTVSKAFNEGKINAPEDVLKTLNDMSEQYDQFAKDRQPISLEDQKTFARQFLGDEKLYQNLPKEMMQNRGKMLAAQQMMTDLATDLTKQLRATDPNDTAGKEQLGKKYMQLLAVMKSFSGARTEAGRILGTLRNTSEAGENAVALTDLHSALMDAGMDKEASAIDVVKAVKKISTPTVIDRFWQLWYANNIMLNPNTYIKHIAGNIVNTVFNMGAGVLRNPMESTGMFQSYFKGWVEGASHTSWGLDRATADEKAPATVIKEAPPGNSLFADKFTKITEYPGKVLNNLNSIFFYGYKEAEAYGIARDQALTEAKTNPNLDVTKRINEIQTNLTKDQEEQTNKFARRGTFTDKVGGTNLHSKGLGVISDVLQKMTNSTATEKTNLQNAIKKMFGGKVDEPINNEAAMAGAVKIPAKLLVPVIRTAGNVLINGLDLTPLSAIDFGLFGSATESAKTMSNQFDRTQQQQITKMMVGSLALTALAQYALAGNVSGKGPANVSQLKNLQMSGWQPNAVRLPNGKWVSYQSTGPLAPVLALLGNWHDENKYNNIPGDTLSDRLSASLIATGKTISDEGFFTGVQGFLDAMNSGGAKASTYLNDEKNFIVSSLAPGAPTANAIHKLFDNTTYPQPADIKSYILQKYGFTGGNQPSLNVFGEPIKGSSSSAINITGASSDPVINYLATNNLTVNAPSKTTKLTAPDGTKVPITPDQYRTYLQQSGQQIKQAINAAINDPNSDLNSAQTKTDKQKIVDEIIRSTRASIKSKIEAQLK